MENLEKVTLPGSVIIASIILSVGMMISATLVGDVSVSNNGAEQGEVVPAEAQNGPQKSLRVDLDKDEHIYGNPDADVFIVEYSDIDCPFCSRVHPIIEKVVDDSDGEVAWVFRHLPLTQIHPEAPRKARATECVARLAGNDSFWEYLSILFEGQTTDVYADFGISEADYNACMELDEVRDAVSEDARRAQEAGGKGTPWSIVANDKVGIPVSGAVPEAVWLETIKSL